MALSNNQATLIVVLGPTGVGKTETTLRIAEHLSTPVINADSRQIFKGLPIGTAAPTPQQQQRVKHLFVGTHNVWDYYSASMFEQDVLSTLKVLFKQQTVALLSGGSMMYIDAVCNGIDDLPTIDEQTRRLFKERLAQEGLDALAEELHKKDPAHWDIVDRKNPRRVIHALEICHVTGKPYSFFRKNKRKERPFRIIKIGLNRPREELYERINSRVNEMVRQGLVDEAMNMLPYRNENALNTVGYKEMFDYLDGLQTLDDTIYKIQSNTRRYARKQLTWFKRDPQIHWFSPLNIEEILNYIDGVL